MADTYIQDIGTPKKVIAMDWDKLIAGHPGPGGRQTGTKDDARNQLAYLQDLSAAVKKACQRRKSYADAEKEIKLPKYEKWRGNEAFLQMNMNAITISIIEAFEDHKVMRHFAPGNVPGPFLCCPLLALSGHS